MVGPIVGDYVQNLRSALDHLAWEMVQKGDGRDHNPNLVQFPIYSIGRSRRTGSRRLRTFENQIEKNLPGVSREQKALARRHQPYHRGQWQLATLAALSNQDKHRVITPTLLFISPDIKQHHLEPTSGRILEWRVLLPDGEPVKETTPFLEVIVDDPEARVEMYATVTTQVTFEEERGRYHRPRALREIGEKAAQIVGEAATRWGNPDDAEVCRRWPVTARKVMGLDIQAAPSSTR